MIERGDYFEQLPAFIKDILVRLDEILNGDVGYKVPAEEHKERPENVIVGGLNPRLHELVMVDKVVRPRPGSLVRLEEMRFGPLENAYGMVQEEDGDIHVRPLEYMGLTIEYSVN